MSKRRARSRAFASRRKATRGLGPALLAAALAGLLAAPAESGRAVPLEAAARRLAEAEQLCNVRSAAAAPLRLRALVRALRLSSGEHAGRYELSWAAPERWRTELRFQGYHRVDVCNEDGRWRASEVPWVPVRVNQLLEGLDVAALLRLGPGERLAAAESSRAEGGRRLVVTLSGGRDGVRTIEFDEDTGLPLSVRSDRLSFGLGGWESVGTAAFPREIVISDEAGPVATVTVRRLAQEEQLAASLFLPPGRARPAGAALEPGDPEWEAYRDRLARFFRRSWRLPREARLGLEGVARLGFSVRRDGEVEGLRILQSSGHAALDRSALAAVAAAAPLPSPPLADGAEALAVSWTVAYNREEQRADPGPPRYPAERPVTGSLDPALAGLDELLLDFLREQDAPGAALAVSRGGRLLAARGYGFADGETRERMQPDARFRIASVSKPLTALTVLSLASEGRLDLDDSPWSLLGLEHEAAAADPRHERLTVEHLLQHRGGFDSTNWDSEALLAAESGRGTDGARAPGARDFVRSLVGQPLDHEPGAYFAYSNAGYAVLGRVIEAVTARPYEDVARERLLEPLGLRDTGVGRDDGRLPGEVRPHLRDPAEVPSADGSGELVGLADGGFSLEAIDSHGGWVASAPDLVRLASALDEPKRSGLLGRRELRRAWERPPGRAGQDAEGRLYASWYGLGWHVRVAGVRGALEQWHDGRLPGGSSLLVRQANGLRWAVLFNQDRGADGRLLAAALEPRLRAFLDEAFAPVLQRLPD